jgi:DnaJ-class molecular chaperone
MKKYCEILGVPLGTSQANIKKHYRALATKLHPDKGGDPKKFQELTHAYNILLGKEQLSRYEIREQQQERQSQNLQSDWKRQEREFQNEVRSKRVARDNAKREARSKIQEQAKTVARPKIARTIQRDVYEICRTCNGLGAIRQICILCHGTGNVVGQSRKPVQFCSTCGSEGHIQISNCATCSGNGRIFIGSRKEIVWE